MAVPGNNQLIEVGRLLGGEPLRAEIIQDDEIGTKERMGGPLLGEFAQYAGQRCSG
jgi:hypothetical protein